MEKITKEFTLNEISAGISQYFTESTLLFDIECTGLSPKNAYIYLIGYATLSGNIITLSQLFASNLDDEILILEEFEKELNKYPIIMGFNSTRFDEAFILERHKRYKTESIIKSKTHIDLYLSTLKAKCLLDLPNYKQKTIEHFLGIFREDKFNGGELIPVYEKYVLEQDLPSKELVLLHNFEDVKGMVELLDILLYKDLLNVELINPSINQQQQFISCTFTIPFILPQAITKTREYASYKIEKDTIELVLNYTNGQLFSYLDNPKDYFYLLNEDIIIPKVIGQSIDKSQKRTATKSECKVALDSDFIFIPKGITIPKGIRIFKKDYNSKEQFIEKSELTATLAENILRFMFKH